MDPVVTPRLVLRDFVQADWKAVHEYAQDPQVTAMMDWGPNSVDQTLDFLKRTMEENARPTRRKYGLAITLTAEEGRVIGGARMDFTAGPREADLGYVLNRAYWGRGYATEAARGLLELGFGRLGLHRAWATCDPRNAASARVLEKIGMRREGHLRESKLVKGDWQDSLVYAMLHREWKGLKEAGK